MNRLKLNNDGFDELINMHEQHGYTFACFEIISMLKSRHGLSNVHSIIIDIRILNNEKFLVELPKSNLQDELWRIYDEDNEK